MDKAWNPETARSLSLKLAMGFAWLSKEAMADPQPGAAQARWRMKPKFHMLQELLEFQSFSLGNPRGFWEYQDEDFVGTIATLALKRGGANTHLACSGNVISRYLALLSLGQI
jgi:hypothetical protein